MIGPEGVAILVGIEVFSIWLIVGIILRRRNQDPLHCYRCGRDFTTRDEKGWHHCDPGDDRVGVVNGALDWKGR